MDVRPVGAVWEMVSVYVSIAEDAAGSSAHAARRLVEVSSARPK